MIEDINQNYEVREEDKYVNMSLQEDIYALTYACFITKNDARLHRDLMLKSTLTFALQVVLIVIVISSEIMTNTLQFYLGDWMINFARIICTSIMHI